MGLREQIQSLGQTFSKKNVTITNSAGGSVSSSLNDFGGAYIILGASANKPCRIQLYQDLPSMNTDITRLPTVFDPSESVGLIGDIVLSSIAPLLLNPPIIGTTLNAGTTFYRVSSSVGNLEVNLEVYPIGKTNDSVTDRSFLVISGSQVPTSSWSAGTFGVSGSIPTPKSFILINGRSTYNLNPDPQWELGNTDGGSGWEFLQQTASLRNIRAVDSKVKQDFPSAIIGSTQIAAKISTRTGTFWKDGNFYKVPVTTGHTYKFSAWVWCSGSLQGFANIPAATCGVIGTMLDGVDSTVGYQEATVPGNVPSWQKAEATFTVGSGTASMLIAPYLNVPYPKLTGDPYGEPTCSAAYLDQPLLCPGYGWFTGFTVEDMTNFGSRLRLYSRDINSVSQIEQTRSFSTETAENSGLIADLIFESASFTYPLVPVLEAYTFKQSEYSSGSNVTSYILENLSTSGPVYSGSLDTSINIYSIED